jgi:hypothetical protein
VRPGSESAFQSYLDHGGGSVGGPAQILPYRHQRGSHRLWLIRIVAKPRDGLAERRLPLLPRGGLTAAHREQWRTEVDAVLFVALHFSRESFFSETLFSEGTTLVPRAHDTRTTPRSDRNRPALTYRDNMNMTATNQPHAGQAIPGLLNDIVTTFVFRSDFLPDTRDLARLRAVSCAMRDAVDATGREVKELNALEAAEIGCISVLERLHQNGLLSPPEITHVPFPASINVPDVGQLYRVTARSGQLEVLKWLRAKSLWWPHRVEGWHFHAFLGAAEGGNIEIIKWLLASGQQWDAAVCAIAAQFGQLEALKWLHTNGCPWDERTCWGAAHGGHFEILKWAHANDCPWDAQTCWRAAEGGHLEMLKWARANGCPWDCRTISFARQHDEVVQWAILNGCPQEDLYDDSGFDTEFGHSDDPFGENDSEDDEDDGFW